MSKPRLTIDVMIVRDLLGDGRRQDADAQDKQKIAAEIFGLSRRGEVELATAPQGYRDEADEALGERLRAFLESEGIPELRQLPYPSRVTYPSEDFHPGDGVPGFREAWASISADWRTHEGKPPGDKDAWHIETHIHEGRDVFLTRDRDLLAMCRRLRDEHGLPILAMRPEEHLATRQGA